MTPEERDDLILAYLDGGPAPAGLDASLREDPATARRLAELSLQESLLSDLARTERPAPLVRRKRPRPAGARPSLTLPFAAAAALAFGAILLATLVSKPAPPAPPSVQAPSPPPVEQKPAPRVGPPREEAPPPLPSPKEPPPPSTTPVPPPIVDRPKEPAAAPPPPTPTPAPVPPTHVARLRPVRIAGIRGTLLRGAERLEKETELASTEMIAASRRRPAAFRTDDGVAVTLDPGAATSFERTEAGATRVRLQGGAAYFEVPPRDRAFVVATAHGEVSVLGTAFQVETDEKRAAVLVVAGQVRLANEKGDVLVRAGQRSTARASERPSTPAKADVEGLTAWRKPPPASGPYLEHEPGRKLPGLVLAAPFGEGEPHAERLARAAAERLDAALVLGHRYRDVRTRTWINLDRGMEGDVRDDGTVGGERFSDRARQATAEYLGALRSAAGVGPRDPVPLVLHLREHYVPDLDACEVAVSGIPKATLLQARSFYAQLLDKHAPAWRLEVRFQGLDDKRPFACAEEDARIEGYMAPRNARAALAFFLPPAFAKRPENVDDYAKILAELIEFLHARRR